MSPNRKELLKQNKELEAKCKRYKIAAEAGLFLACTLRMSRNDNAYPNLLHMDGAELEAMEYFEEAYTKNVDAGKVMNFYGAFRHNTGSKKSS